MIVADAGPLIAFARIGRLGILPEVLGTVLVPTPVVQECLRDRSRPDARVLARALEDGVLVRRAFRTSAFYEALSLDLGAGESAAIALARSLERPVLLDERRARRVAERLGIAVVGSGGVLVEAKRLRLLPRVGPVIDALRGSGYRLSDALVAEILRRCGETR